MLYFLKGPSCGNYHILKAKESTGGGEPVYEVLATFEGFGKGVQLAAVTLKDILLEPGLNTLLLEAAGRDERAIGMEMAFVGLGLTPSSRHFVREWNLAAPFQAADMDDLLTVYPPENETDLKASYAGKNGTPAGWRVVQADDSGYVDLSRLVQPNEQVVAYALAYVLSPDDRDTYALLGSDDGVRVWLNGTLVHSHPSYRGAAPDQDRFPVRLQKGRNKVLVKVLQGAGGWGFYFRLADPKAELVWALQPGESPKGPGR